MIKRIFQFGLALLLFVSVTIPAAASEPVVVPIPPYTEYQVYTLSPGEVGVIEFEWTACTEGLVNVFIKASYFEITLLAWDGSTILVVTEDEINNLWSPIERIGFTNEWCRGGQKCSYASWQVRLSDLPPGEYELHFSGGIRHPLTDGGDYDGNGTPDVIPPEYYGGETVNYLTVLQP